mgnify:CR=1 FL=1
MENIDMFVDFKKYCKTCKHKDTDEKLDPCHECLENPVNTNSRKPVNYKEKEK